MSILCPKCGEPPLCNCQIEKLKSDRDKWRSMCAKMAEALKKIADNPECDGTAEYWEWGNYDDTYRYGVSRGRSIQAELAKEARASYEAMKKEFHP